MIDYLSDTLGEFIIDKFSNPCKKCLVKAICRPQFQECDSYRQYIDRRYEAGDTVKVCALISLLIIEFIIIIAAIEPEFYEWFKSTLLYEWFKSIF